MFWRSLAIVTALRMLVAALLPLTLDEPYYWLWAHHLAAGYYDHPPLVAWLSAPFVPLGNAPIVIRLAALLCSTVCPILIYVYTLRVTKRETAAAAAGIALTVAPYYSVMAILEWPEPALLMTWAWTLLAWHTAVFDERATYWRWLHAGVALGLCLLSKFTAFAVPVGIALFFTIAPRSRRRWLLTPWPWIAAATALAVYSPFLIWNARHDWQTFVFQATARSHGGLELNAGQIPAFVGETLVGLSPLIALAFIPSVVRAFRGAVCNEGEPLLLPLAISLPPLLFLWLLVPLATVQVYWTLCCYLGLFPLLGAWYANHLTAPLTRRATRGGYAAVTVAMIPLIVATPAVVFPSLLFRVAGRSEGSGLTEMYGMKAVGVLMDREREAMPRPAKTFYAAEDHRLASHLALLSDRPIMMFTGDRRGLEYLRWEEPRKVAGQDCLFLMREPFEVDRGRLGEQLRQVFDRVDAPAPHVVTWNGYPARRFFLARCYDFHAERAENLTRLP